MTAHDEHQQALSIVSDDQYADVFNWFVENSNHDETIFTSFQEILECKEKRRSYLDIGSGDGRLARRVAPYFENTVLLEPNTTFGVYDELKYNRLETVPFLDLVTHERFDFILCSHVLYYINPDNWDEFIAKMYGMLEDDGIGVVVLEKEDKNFKNHELRMRINPTYRSSTTVKDVMNRNGIYHHDISYLEVLEASERDSDRVQHLVRMFTIDQCFTPDEYKTLSKERQNYIDDIIRAYVPSLQCDDGSYRVESPCETIVMKRFR